MIKKVNKSIKFIVILVVVILCGVAIVFGYKNIKEKELAKKLENIDLINEYNDLTNVGVGDKLIIPTNEK